MKEAKEKNREFLSRETFLSRKGDVMSVVKFEEFRILFPDPGWLNLRTAKFKNLLKKGLNLSDSIATKE